MTGKFKEPAADPNPETLTPTQFLEAFRLFKASLVHHETDLRLEPFLAVPSKDPGERPFSWLRAARTALQLKTVDVAARMGISRKRYTLLELADDRGALSVAELEAGARALDCEVLLALRPREKKPYAQRLWSVAWPASIDHPWVQSRPSHLKSYALAAVARDLVRATEFRRAQGWSERTSLPATRPRKSKKIPNRTRPRPAPPVTIEGHGST